MIIDATFWVAVAFIIFVLILFYFKIPQKVLLNLDGQISSIKKQIDNAEKLKDEAKNLLSESEKKISNSKKEIENLIIKSNEDIENNIIKTNDEFHAIMDNRKKNAEGKIRQLKLHALDEIKTASVKISLLAAENLIRKTIDKSKLQTYFDKGIEQTKSVLKKNLKQ